MIDLLVLYTRVSTDKQTNQAQLEALQEAAPRWPHTHLKIIQETASGSTPWRQRQLANVLGAPHDTVTILTPELSRLGRSTLDVLDFLAECRKNAITVHALKGNFTVDDSMSSKVLTTILALTAELERDFLRARTKEGIATARAKGRAWGRPTGPAASHRLDPQTREIKRLLAAGVPKTSIARLLNVSRNTVYRYLDRLPAAMPTQEPDLDKS